MESGREVLCAADFMGNPRLLLEAERKALYDAMLVPPDWHQDYAEGKTTTRGFHKFIRGHTQIHSGAHGEEWGWGRVKFLILQKSISKPRVMWGLSTDYRKRGFQNNWPL